MRRGNGEVPPGSLRWPALPIVGLILIWGIGCAHAACPKLLMFDGVDILTQTNAAQARYWGQLVGVQGFFLNNVMPRWQQNVGLDRQSKLWRLARRFQVLYSAEGVTDNFIKVAVYKPHDWYDAKANVHVADNFEHAAELAKNAGFKGVALDLEPYVPIWGGEAGGMELAPTVYKEGRAIGLGMRRAYPGITLVLISDAQSYWHGPRKGYHGGYALSEYFERGLLSAGFKHVVFAIEETYETPIDKVVAVVKDAHARYRDFIHRQDLEVGQFSIAPGVWPLGKSDADKSARMSADDFRRDLEAAYRSTDDYVWIYGYSSAWQTDGPYGEGPAVSDFDDYVTALKQVRKRQCPDSKAIPGPGAN